MAIRIKTSRPLWVINQIKARIDNGIIDTWSYDDEGDFTHVGQWANRAWIRPRITSDGICFNILGHRSMQMPLMDYAVFHGRFLELLINQFPTESASLVISAPMEDEGDFNNVNLD